MKVVKKLLLILLTVVLSILAVAFLAWSALHAAKYFIYPEYYRDARAASPLPDLNNGFRPQGVFYDAESKSYIHSGSKGEYASLYVVDEKGNAKELIPIYKEKEEQSLGRGGAVVRVGDYVYICDNENQNNSINGILYTFLYKDIMSAKNGAKVKCIEKRSTACAMSAMFTDGTFLYVAEYYSAGTNYSTHKDHHYTTPEGVAQKAMLFAYPLNEDGSLALTFADREGAEPETIFLPAFALSLPDEVTGFAIKDGVIMLTHGADWQKNQLTFYSRWQKSDDTVQVAHNSVPIYYLDSGDVIDSVKLPMCAGNMTLIEGNRVAVTFESASNYYIVGKFFFAYNLVSFPIPKAD